MENSEMTRQDGQELKGLEGAQGGKKEELDSPKKTKGSGGAKRGKKGKKLEDQEKKRSGGAQAGKKGKKLEDQEKKRSDGAQAGKKGKKLEDQEKKRSDGAQAGKKREDQEKKRSGGAQAGKKGKKLEDQGNKDFSGAQTGMLETKVEASNEDQSSEGSVGEGSEKDGLSESLKALKNHKETLIGLIEKLTKLSISDDVPSDNTLSATTPGDTTPERTEVTSSAGSEPGSQVVDMGTIYEKVDAFLMLKNEYCSGSGELHMRGDEIENLLIENKDSLIKQDKTMYWLKLGQLYSVIKRNKQLAIVPLSKVIKLDPNITEAWNVLAECYWFIGDYILAQNCLEISLEQERKKEPLRHLSIIYRKLATLDSDKRIEYTETGVRLAKEAVNKDVKDSISWGILGNAYLHAYFNLINDVKSAQLAIAAYKQAVKLNTDQNNTELHYNLALANKYCEYYHESLISLDLVLKQENGWEPAVKLKCQLLIFLNNVQYFHSSRGKLRPKRISKYQKELVTVQIGSFIQSLNLATTNIRSLVNGKNNGALIYGKVMWTLSQEESFPFTCGCLEASGDCFIVLVYNITPGKGFIIGDTLFVPEPHYKSQQFEYDDVTFEFPSIRVDNPTHLIVNKKKVSADYFTPYTLITTEKEHT